MPSALSFSNQQYYGNPNNSFWWVMSDLLKFSLELGYSERVKKLETSPFAVWDVLKFCDREGSLDSSIIRSSEIPNNIAGFLGAYKSVELLAFNGAAAKNIYQRHCAETVINTLRNQDPPKLIQLPSTSPAYASMKKQEKRDHWFDAFSNYL